MSNRISPIIFALALPGLFFGVATIFAVIHGREHFVALATLATIGAVAAVLAPDAALRIAFASGFLAALIAVWLQGAFLDLYFDNNPDYRMDVGPFGLNIRLFVFVMSPVGAMIAGGVSALTALFVKFLFTIIGSARRDTA